MKRLKKLLVQCLAAPSIEAAYLVVVGGEAEKNTLFSRNSGNFSRVYFRGLVSIFIILHNNDELLLCSRSVRFLFVAFTFSTQQFFAPPYVQIESIHHS